MESLTGPNMDFNMGNNELIFSDGQLKHKKHISRQHFSHGNSFNYLDIAFCWFPPMRFLFFLTLHFPLRT